MVQDAERGLVPMEGWGVQVYGTTHGVKAGGAVRIRGKRVQVDGSVAQHPRFAILVTKGPA